MKRVNVSIYCVDVQKHESVTQSSEGGKIRIHTGPPNIQLLHLRENYVKDLKIT